MTLYERLPNSVEWNGKKYRLNLSFPAVLAMFDVLDDENLSNAMRIETALDLLITEHHPKDSELLKEIIQLLIPNKQASKKEPVMDFRQDWEYIYAAFRQAYGIDLYQELDLHYLLFSALLKSLPSNTRFAEIVEIRQTPIPHPTKYNTEERNRIIRLKSEFSLKKENTFQDGLRNIFCALKTQAEGR